MPADIGRQMLGVMDETGTLEYGQVFVQFSPDIAAPGVTTFSTLALFALTLLIRYDTLGTSFCMIQVLEL